MLNVDMRSVIMLNVVMRSVIMLNVVIRSVIMLNVVMLNVIMLSVVAPDKLVCLSLIHFNPSLTFVSPSETSLALVQKGQNTPYLSVQGALTEAQYR